MDLQSTEFLDEDSLRQDAQRFFEVCAGCRRCFNLCPSFEHLLHQVDQYDEQLDKLFPNDFDRVVDLCFYCKLCLNHCPFSPPHDYRLDFPLLMLRAKAIRHQQESFFRWGRLRERLRDRLLVNMDGIGRWASRFAVIVNRFLRNRWFRTLLHAVLGIHRDRHLPAYSRHSFTSWASRRSQQGRPSDQAAALLPGMGEAGVPRRKVALFYSCFVNYNQPEIGIAAVQVLEKNGIDVVFPAQQCCGMPYADIGDLSSMKQKAAANLQPLRRMVDQGMDVIGLLPSCSLMIKKEYPALLGGADASQVADHTYDFCEYLIRLHGEGRFSTDFKSGVGNLVYQIPCHLRDQNIGYKSRDLLALIPGTSVDVIERCSGHDGTWGVKAEHFETSMEIGSKLFQRVTATSASRVVSDCPLAGHQVTQGTGRSVLHPAQILAMAYGRGEPG